MMFWPQVCTTKVIMEEQSYFGKIITNSASTLLVILAILLFVLES